MIRSLQRAYPNKIISHPDLEDIRALRPRAIVLIDDFIGSGKRSLDFINSMWICKTMKSWISLKYLNITVLTYSGTYPGLVSIQLHPAHPKVIVDRYCPSLSDLPWSSPVFQDVKNLCERYGHRINQKRFALGFRKSMGTMVFEHGCPNNAPAILWYDEPGIWNALFPMKTVTATEKAFFPSEIEPPPAEEILTEIGEKKLAHPGVLSRVGPAGRQVILILGLLSKGVKSLPALSFATGLSASGVAEILTRCMTWNFINKQLRLTRIGYSELRYARSCSKSDFPLPDWSEESYHPRQLRKITHG